jgi:hypothetical protein
MSVTEPTKFSYSILPEQKLCLLRFAGHVSLGHVTRGVQQLWADPAYDPFFNGIVNLEGVTTRAGLDELQSLITFFQQRRSSAGQWVVVFTEPKPTALGMMFKAAWKGSFNIEVVSTWEAACRFLRVDLPAFAPGG